MTSYDGLSLAKNQTLLSPMPLEYTWCTTKWRMTARPRLTNWFAVCAWDVSTYLSGHRSHDSRFKTKSPIYFQFSIYLLTSPGAECSLCAQWSPGVISTENLCQSGNANHSTSVHRLIQCRRHTHGHPHRHVRRLNQEQPSRNSQSVGVEVPNSFGMRRT